ncbi:MFS transporter [Oenococcus sp. UCMA 17063]|nr:MFS transporter [Oenococcus sp. UCMA 17063]
MEDMKKFSILMVGETASRIGNNLFDIAIIWYVNKLTSSTAIVGGVTALFNSVVFLEVFTGYFADKIPKAKLMLIIDVLQVLAMITAIVMYSILGTSELLVVCVAFFSKLLGSFFDPTVNAIIPELVDDRNLDKANGINQGIQFATQLIGMLFGGILIAWISLSSFLIVNAITFIVSFISILFLVAKFKIIQSRDLNNRSVLEQSNLVSGIKYVYRNKKLLQIVIISMLTMFLVGPFMSLDVVWVTRVLKSNATIYALTEIMLIIGLLIGNLLAGFIKITLHANLIFSLVCMGLCLAIIGLTKSVFLTLLLVIPFGGSAGIVSVKIMSYLQTTTPKELMGRVTGATTGLSNTAMPLGMLLGGLISEKIGVSLTFIFIGIIIIIFGMSLPLVLLSQLKKAQK